jgi:hypothetical protein
MAKSPRKDRSSERKLNPKRLVLPAKGDSTNHQCGLLIVSAAVGGQILQSDQCAYTTYIFETAPGAVSAVIAPPVGIYWGPKETIPYTLPSGTPATVYRIRGGVVFQNC